MNYRSKRKKRPLRYYQIGGYTNPYSGYTASLDTSISPASGFGSGQLGTSQMMPQSSTSIGAFDTGNFDTASYFGGDSARGGGGMDMGSYANYAQAAIQAAGQLGTMDHQNARTEDYFDVVDQGDKVLRDAQAIFKAEYKLDILPEEIAEELMPVILSKQYSPKTVQNAIQDIVSRDKTNIRQLQEATDLLEYIEDYENFPDGPLTRQEYELIDPKDIADAKKELAKLRRVGNRKSYIQRLLDKRERTLKRSIERDKESGQLRLPIDD